MLGRAGWHEGRRLPPETLAAMRRSVGSGAGRFGGRLTSHRLADEVLTEFGGLTVHSDLAGLELRPPELTFEPALVSDRVEAIIDAGRAIGLPVYPLGAIGPERAPLLLTEPGGAFAVDPVGDWFLGGTIEEALDLLITGRHPQPVTTIDGRSSSVLFTGQAAAAFYLPRTPLNLPYGWLPDVLHRIGAPATARAADPGRFEIEDWGGLRCEVEALDLESHTVLVIGLDRDALHSTGLTEVFRVACVGLAPELEVALVTLPEAGDVSGLVADRAGPALLDQGHQLLYLTDRIDYGVQPGTITGYAAELPITGGRLWTGSAS